MLPFLALAIFITCIVALYRTPQRERLTLKEILTEANYYAIARMEQAIWDGNSFHCANTNGGCRCNMICYPETFYLPTAQPIRTDPEEWRDRYGE